MFGEVGLGIGDGDRDCFGRTFNVVENESDGNCVDDVLVESLDVGLGCPSAGEESGGFCETLRSIWGIFDFDLYWLSELSGFWSIINFRR